MKLSEALDLSWCATKHVDDPTPGTYTLSKRILGYGFNDNGERGYYDNFQRDDPEQQIPCRPFYWEDTGDVLVEIASEYGEDGWEPK